MQNIEGISFDQCCSGKAISTTYSECAFVELGFQHVMSMRHIVICGLLGYNTFLCIIW